MSTDERFRTIVVDPPWPLRAFPAWEARGDGGVQAASAGQPYKSMTHDEIAALPVASYATDNAHLYVWTTNLYLERTYGIVRGWGFNPAQLLVWVKAPMGLGLAEPFGSLTEFVIFARRGGRIHHARCERNWWQWSRGKHSTKPEAFLDVVESVSPGPYLELFARRDRLGWATWGNESLGTVAS